MLLMSICVQIVFLRRLFVFLFLSVIASAAQQPTEGKAPPMSLRVIFFSENCIEKFLANRHI
jgi:hypothetical protein